MKTLIEQSRPAAYLMLLAMLGTAAFSNSLFEITSSLFLGLWLLDAAARRRGSVFSGRWVLILSVYVLVNAASLTQAAFSHVALKGAFRVLRWALLTLAVADIVDTRERFGRVIDAVLAVAAFVAVDALIQAVTGVEILRGRRLTAFYGPTGRVTGPFPHANDFSAYLLLALFAYASTIAACARERARLAAALAGTALTVVCLALTYARGAWLAAVAALLLWALLRRSPWPVVLIAVFAAVAYARSPFLFQDRLATLGRLAGGTVVERRLLWSESIEMIRERPVLGFGVNTYSENVVRFKDREHPTDRQYAHNGYLQIAAETGLAGLAAFLAVMMFFLVRTAGVFRLPGDAALRVQGLWLGVAALLLQSATDTTLQSLLLSGHLWIWIGLGWAGCRLSGQPADR